MRDILSGALNSNFEACEGELADTPEGAFLRTFIAAGPKMRASITATASRFTIKNRWPRVCTRSSSPISAWLSATRQRSSHGTRSSTDIALALPASKSGWNTAAQQLFFRQQPSVLERLETRQLAQRVEPELRQEGFRRHIGVGRTRLWRARPRGDQLLRAQHADQIARQLLAEEEDSSPRVIGWK